MSIKDLLNLPPGAVRRGIRMILAETMIEQLCPAMGEGDLYAHLRLPSQIACQIDTGTSC